MCASLKDHGGGFFARAQAGRKLWFRLHSLSRSGIMFRQAFAACLLVCGACISPSRRKKDQAYHHHPPAEWRYAGDLPGQASLRACWVLHLSLRWEAGRTTSRMAGQDSPKRQPCLEAPGAARWRFFIQPRSVRYRSGCTTYLPTHHIPPPAPPPPPPPPHTLPRPAPPRTPPPPHPGHSAGAHALPPPCDLPHAHPWDHGIPLDNIPACLGPCCTVAPACRRAATGGAHFTLPATAPAPIACTTTPFCPAPPPPCPLAVQAGMPELLASGPADVGRVGTCNARRTGRKEAGRRGCGAPSGLGCATTVLSAGAASTSLYWWRHKQKRRFMSAAAAQSSAANAEAWEGGRKSCAGSSCLYYSMDNCAAFRTLAAPRCAAVPDALSHACCPSASMLRAPPACLAQHHAALPALRSASTWLWTNTAAPNSPAPAVLLTAAAWRVRITATTLPFKPPRAATHSSITCNIMVGTLRGCAGSRGAR